MMKKIKKKLMKVKAARRRLGLTLRTLQEKVGVSRQALSAYERGIYPPKDEVWEKLKEILRLKGTVEDYWGRTAHAGKAKMYHEGAECYIKGCHNAPVSKGLCRKHYQRIRYQRLTHGVIPEISEA
jgi:DNA-binding XRE family transcriptional regulator